MHWDFSLMSLAPWINMKFWVFYFKIFQASKGWHWEGHWAGKFKIKIQDRVDFLNHIISCPCVIICFFSFDTQRTSCSSSGARRSTRTCGGCGTCDDPKIASHCQCVPVFETHLIRIYFLGDTQRLFDCVHHSTTVKMKHHFHSLPCSQTAKAHLLPLIWFDLSWIPSAWSCSSPLVALYCLWPCPQVQWRVSYRTGSGREWVHRPAVPSTAMPTTRECHPCGICIAWTDWTNRPLLTRIE